MFGGGHCSTIVINSQSVQIAGVLDKDLWREGACLLVLFDSSAKLSYHVSVDLLTSAKLKQSWRSVSTKENFDPRPSNCDIHIKGEKLLIPKGSKYDYTVLQPLQTASLKHVHRHMTHTKKSDRIDFNPILTATLTLTLENKIPVIIRHRKNVMPVITFRRLCF